MDLAKMFCVSVWFAGREASALATFVVMDTAEDQRFVQQRRSQPECWRPPFACDGSRAP
jgi:hypothetical protein